MTSLLFFFLLVTPSFGSDYSVVHPAKFFSKSDPSFNLKAYLSIDTAEAACRAQPKCKGFCKQYRLGQGIELKRAGVDTLTYVKQYEMEGLKWTRNKGYAMELLPNTKGHNLFRSLA